MIIFLSLLVLVLLAALAYAGSRIEYLQTRIDVDLVAAFEEHTAVVLTRVTNHHAYEVLYAAAEAYDTPGEQARAQMLGRTRRQDGPSVPAMWMMERGHIIRSRDDE